MSHPRTEATAPVAPLLPGSGRGCSCCTTRRQVLRAVGAAALVPGAGAVLAGCGDGGGSVSEPTVADGTVTVPAADTPVGGASYYADAKVVVTQPTEGDYQAFDSTCPHQGCPTSGFEGGVLVCPCHGSRFDPSTGEAVHGPAESGLRVLTVTLDGGNLQIRG
jgi:Rieske Fe-S protein